VIANSDGKVALVRAREGTLLPGGGIEEGESAHEAIVREVAEECAFAVTVTGVLGDAIQFVNSTARGAWCKKPSQFVSASAGVPAGVTPEHETIWLPSDAAVAEVTYESHAWAIRRWQRLNT
jgi:8-oxo-dGTP pyrophosphatase MutT (NUDIX family)